MDGFFVDSHCFQGFTAFKQTVGSLDVGDVIPDWSIVCMRGLSVSVLLTDWTLSITE